MELIPFGEDGWLIPTDDPIGLAALIDRTGLDDVVPGQRHVLLRGSQQRVMAAVAGVPEDRPVRAAREVRHLPAQWEGPDLRHVAETAGMSELAVIRPCWTPPSPSPSAASPRVSDTSPASMSDCTSPGAIALAPRSRPAPSPSPPATARCIPHPPRAVGT